MPLLPYIEPIFAEGIENVGLVGDDHDIGPGGWQSSRELAQRLCTPVILDRGHDQTALGEIGRWFDLAKPEQFARLDSAIEHAGVDLPDRDFELVHGLPNRPREGTALVVKLPLLVDVLKMERIRIGLIRVGRAVPDHNDVPTVAQCTNPFRRRRRQLAV
jgi:hypothetical protein